MEESVRLAKELQICANCPKNTVILVVRIDPSLFATYFLILIFKEADLKENTYKKIGYFLNPSEKLL